MNVKVLDLKKGKLKLTITLSPKEMVVYFVKSYEKIAPTIKIDGFRAGKAPRKVIEGAAGIARILSEGLDMAVSESYFSALKEKKIIPITQPKIVINKYPDYGQTESEIKGEFEFEAEIDALPEVKLDDYSKIKVDKKEVEKAKKEDVDKVLEHFRKQNSKLNAVERPARKGDHLEISYDGSIKHVKIDQMCSKNHPLILGENSLIPGFEDELVGMKKGDKKEFKINFPIDYHAKEFASKEATFSVEVIEVREIELPDLDEGFAQKFGHDTMDALKTAIEENLNLELKENNKRELESRIMDKVLPLLQVDIPEILIDHEVDRMISDFAGQINSRGVNFDRYLEGMKKSKEDLDKEMRPQAEKNVKIGLLLGKIVEENRWDQNDPGIGKKAMEYLVEKIAK